MSGLAETMLQEQEYSTMKRLEDIFTKRVFSSKNWEDAGTIVRPLKEPTLAPQKSQCLCPCYIKYKTPQKR